MKHLDFFKGALATAVVLLALSSCTKHDEISFRGTIVDIRECNVSYSRHNDAGFVVKLDSPDSVGGTYILNGTPYPNSVILYDPGCRLFKGDKLSGSFYFDDKYSRANCSIHWSDINIPEGVFLSLSVD